MNKSVITKRELMSRVKGGSVLPLVASVLMFVFGGEMAIGSLFLIPHVSGIVILLMGTGLVVGGIFVLRRSRRKSRCRKQALENDRFDILHEPIIHKCVNSEGVHFLMFPCGANHVVSRAFYKKCDIGALCYLVYIHGEKNLLVVYDARRWQPGDDVKDRLKTEE